MGSRRQRFRLKRSSYKVDLVQVGLLGFTFCGFVFFLTLYATQIRHFKLLRNAFWGFINDSLKSIFAPADNIVQWLSGSDVSHYAGDCALALVYGWVNEITSSVRQGYRHIWFEARFSLCAPLALVRPTSPCWLSWNVGHSSDGYCTRYPIFIYGDSMRSNADYTKGSIHIT